MKTSVTIKLPQQTKTRLESICRRLQLRQEDVLEAGVMIFIQSINTKDLVRRAEFARRSGSVAD